MSSPCCSYVVFRKALKYLEAIQPPIKLLTQQQHIGYKFNELENDDRDSFIVTDKEDCEDDSDYVTEYGELIFGYKRSDSKVEVSSPDNSMETSLFRKFQPKAQVKEH